MGEGKYQDFTHKDEKGTGSRLNWSWLKLEDQGKIKETSFWPTVFSYGPKEVSLHRCWRMAEEMRSKNEVGREDYIRWWRKDTSFTELRPASNRQGAPKVGGEISPVHPCILTDTRYTNVLHFPASNHSYWCISGSKYIPLSYVLRFSARGNTAVYSHVYVYTYEHFSSEIKSTGVFVLTLNLRGATLISL